MVLFLQDKRIDKQNKAMEKIDVLIICSYCCPMSLFFFLISYSPNYWQ
jgi:hypothetical protein